ncbi:MAG: hypothetical protein ACD_51C00113G0001 [uncultured bacterium]|nr:MAG: hypothetical protein ACD_51C00113G0001 [uncultured bacterium]
MAAVTKSFLIYGYWQQILFVVSPSQGLLLGCKAHFGKRLGMLEV